MAVERQAELQARGGRGAGSSFAACVVAITPPRIVRRVLAWLVMWACFVTFALLSLAYSLSFGDTLTRAMLSSFAIAEGQALVIEVRCCCARGVLRARAAAAPPAARSLSAAPRPFFYSGLEKNNSSHARRSRC